MMLDWFLFLCTCAGCALLAGWLTYRLVLWLGPAGSPKAPVPRSGGGYQPKSQAKAQDFLPPIPRPPHPYRAPAQAAPPSPEEAALRAEVRELREVLRSAQTALEVVCKKGWRDELGDTLRRVNAVLDGKR